MKKSFKVIALLLAICILVGPVVLLGQDVSQPDDKKKEPEASEREYSQGLIDGKADARNDAHGALWFTCGFFTQCIGVGAAILASPSPNSEKFIGKSPDYIEAYTSAYRSKRRSLQTTWSMVGCVASNCIVLTAVTIAVASSPDNTCGPTWDCNPFQGCNDTMSDWNTCMTDCSSGPDCGTASSPGCGSSSGCESSSCQ